MAAAREARSAANPRDRGTPPSPAGGLATGPRPGRPRTRRAPARSSAAGIGLVESGPAGWRTSCPTTGRSSSNGGKTALSGNLGEKDRPTPCWTASHGPAAVRPLRRPSVAPGLDRRGPGPGSAPRPARLRPRPGRRRRSDHFVIPLPCSLCPSSSPPGASAPGARCRSAPAMRRPAGRRAARAAPGRRRCAGEVRRWRRRRPVPRPARRGRRSDRGRGRARRGRAASRVGPAGSRHGVEPEVDSTRPGRSTRAAPPGGRGIEWAPLPAATAGSTRATADAPASGLVARSPPGAPLRARDACSGWDPSRARRMPRGARVRWSEATRWGTCRWSPGEDRVDPAIRRKERQSTDKTGGRTRAPFVNKQFSRERSERRDGIKGKINTSTRGSPVRPVGAGPEGRRMGRRSGGNG
jgi:hypothetical protein